MFVSPLSHPLRDTREPLYGARVNLTSEITVQHLAAVIPALLSPEVVQADHYFIPNPAGTGLSPVWDFRTNQILHGQENAVFAGKGAGSVVPPVDPPLWPSQWTHGQTKNISVEYFSQYWFFGGSL
jgi:hypothetical protein